MIACPTSEQLQEFLAEDLAPSVATEIEAHIDLCLSCRQLLAALSQESAEISRVIFPAKADASQTTDVASSDFLLRLKNQQFRVSDLPNRFRSDSFKHPLETNHPLPGILGYEVLEEIGRGGMGVVYKAKHLGLNRYVALKMLLGSRFESEDSRRRFRREAQAIGRLQNPHIVQVFDFGETEAGPYFSLELLESGSLARRLDGNTWDPNAAARFVERLAWAIQYAHEQGVVHRDLKPANILLQRGTGENPVDKSASPTDSSHKTHPSMYVPKISDFGLAKCSEDGLQTIDGTILGTPSYLAPEQTETNQSNIGPTVDVYGLGAILYELLTGSPPFRGNSVMSTLLMVTHQLPARPSRLGIKIPRDLETICLKCLEKSPAKRFATAGLLAEDLHRFLAGEPVLARPVGSAELAWRWCRRNPVVAFLLAGIVFVTSVGFAGTARAWRSASEGWNRAQFALDREISANEKLVDQREKTESSLYFQKLALAHNAWLEFNIQRANDLLEQCPPERRSWEWQYLHRLCNDEILSLKGHNLPVNGVAFSPNGQRIATVTGEWPINVLRTDLVSPEPGEVRIWNAATGEEQIRCIGHRGSVMGVTFSPDGKYLATCSSDKTARIWDAETGNERFLLTSQDNGWIHSVAFSPDGSRIALATANIIQIWDSSNGQQLRTLRGHTGSVHSVSFTHDGTRIVSGSRDRTIKVWSADDSGESTSSMTMDGPHDVRSLAISPDDRLVVAGGYDSVVKVFELATGTEIVTQLGHATNIRSVAFSADGRTVASSDHEGRVLLWDAQTGRNMRIIRGHAGSVFSLSFGPDGKRLATGGIDGTAKIWDVTSEQAYRELLPREGWLLQLSFSPDGRWLAAPGAISSAGHQSKARIWNVKTRQPLQELKGHAKAVMTTAFDPESHFLATGSADHTVKIWTIPEGRIVATLAGHTDAVTSVAYSPDGRWIVSGSLDKTVNLWDAQKATAAAILPAAISTILPSVPAMEPTTIQTNHTSGISCLSVSSNNRWIATGDVNGTIRILNREDGNELLALEGMKGPVTSLAFNPNGYLLAAACGDEFPRLWTLVESDSKRVSAAPPHLFHGHFDIVRSVAFNSDGRRLGSASLDDTVRLWDVASGQETIAMKTPALLGQTSIAFSPDGHALAVAGNGTTLWETAHPDRNTPEWFKSWHRNESNLAKQDHEWFAAVYHLTQLLERDPESSALRLERAEQRLFLSQWELATRDFAVHLQVRPADLDILFRQAATALLAKDETLYRAVCRTLVDKFGESRQAIPAYYVARICTLISRTPDDLVQSAVLAKGALESSPQSGSLNGAIQHARAIVQYRAGKYDEAIQTARDSISGVPPWNASEINRFVLAMALHKQGRSDEAIREFNTVVTWIEAARKLPQHQNPQVLGLHPNDWLTFLLFRQEAERELGISNP